MGADFRLNIHTMFYLTKAAVPHMKEGGAIIINSASINADAPNPTLLACATTKGAIQNVAAGLAKSLAPERYPRKCRDARSDLDPAHSSTMSEDAVSEFGCNVPMSARASPRSSRRLMSC
jgi:short chain dehydrogenase